MQMRLEQEREAREAALARLEEESLQRVAEARRSGEERAAAEAAERLRKEEENRLLRERLAEVYGYMCIYLIVYA